MSDSRMDVFDEVTRFAPEGERRFAGQLREAWYQGRGVYGGVVAALLVDAMGACADDRPIRGLDVAFCAPATAGPATIDVEILRAGRNVAQLGARLTREGLLIATGRATFARPRRSALEYTDPASPPFPPPAEVEDGPAALYVPEFCQHFEFRQALGAAPFGGAGEPRLGGWCRPREPHPCDARLVVALLDAWAPAALGLAESWTGAASIELGVSFHRALPDLSVPHDAFYAFEARSRVVGDGYADERSTLWDHQGLPLASARQVVALFG
ncbi:MAG: thioesterase family protein [Sandaracinaceae bacterium]